MDDDSSDSDYEPESETRLPRRRIAGQRGPGMCCHYVFSNMYGTGSSLCFHIKGGLSWKICILCLMDRCLFLLPISKQALFFLIMIPTLWGLPFL